MTLARSLVRKIVVKCRFLPTLTKMGDKYPMGLYLYFFENPRYGGEISYFSSIFSWDFFCITQNVVTMPT